MKMVPLVPITMVRAAGWPLDQTSAVKPAGSLSLSSGILSTAVAVGGVGCPRRLGFCLLSAGLVLSSGLNPGGACAPAGAAISKSPPSRPANTRLPHDHDRDIASSQHMAVIVAALMRSSDICPSIAI